MSDFLTLVSCELIKLRRNLALWMVGIAPLFVVALQALIWLNLKEGLGFDADLWLTFFSNILSIWSLFMFPMFTALVVALIYQYEHTTGGWLRTGTYPVPSWMILAAKQLSALILLTGSTILLVVFTVLGGWITGYFHPVIEMPALIPWPEVLVRTAKIWSASLLVLGIQNWVSLRWTSLSVPIGTGIGGTFVALFATSWRYGYLYPWLLPLNSIYGTDGRDQIAFLTGAIGGFSLLILMLITERNTRKG